MITTSFAEVSNEYQRHFPGLPFLETWIPPTKFLSAEFDGHGSLSISREDDGIYGIALGSKPVISDEWKSFSIESGSAQAIPEVFMRADQWDCHWAPTTSGEIEISTIVSNLEIEQFLQKNAPQSSVFPGNEEILQWLHIFNEGELAAVAALCRWQSGKVVISSVATDIALRGRGIGRELMRKALIAGHHLGESALCLGVMHENESAQRLYAASGFQKMHSFTYFERG